MNTEVRAHDGIVGLMNLLSKLEIVYLIKHEVVFGHTLHGNRYVPSLAPTWFFVESDGLYTVYVEVIPGKKEKLSC